MCLRRVDYSSADMSKPAEEANRIETAAAELDRVDILVKNAGIQHTAPVREFPPERWDAIITINLSAAFHAIRVELPQMYVRNWGVSCSFRSRLSTRRPDDPRHCRGG